MDLGVVGIPCPLFSSLNKNTRKRSRVTETYNPFEARLCSTHVKLFTRQITRSGQAVDHVNHLRIAEVPCYSDSFIFSHTPTHTHSVSVIPISSSTSPQDTCKRHEYHIRKGAPVVKSCLRSIRSRNPKTFVVEEEPGQQCTVFPCRSVSWLA